MIRVRPKRAPAVALIWGGVSIVFGASSISSSRPQRAVQRRLRAAWRSSWNGRRAENRFTTSPKVELIVFTRSRAHRLSQDFRQEEAGENPVPAKPRKGASLSG